MKYLIKTFGCKANLFDSQVLEARLKKRGGTVSTEHPEICVVNSCTVTDEADRQSRRSAKRFKKKYPNARVVMTGCAAQILHQSGDSLEGVEILSNQSRSSFLESEIKEKKDWSLPESLETSPFELPATGKRTRAFLKIQEGCNSFCTFCIIPYGRGPSRSLRPKEILRNIQSLTRQGVREIVLTGTNLGDYGIQWATKGVALVELVDLILNETDLERLRFSSLDPTEITDSLLKRVEKQKRICPHFHVSLQSPNSKTLRMMKRKYGYSEVERCLKSIRSIRQEEGGVYVGMDVITGFPGETESDFEWSYEALASLPWDRLHVFPYSERKGTPALRIKESVNWGERKNRAKRLFSLSSERLKERYERGKGEVFSGVLLESDGVGPDQTRNWLFGHSRNYLRFWVPRTGPIQTNQVFSLRAKNVFVTDQNAEANYIALLSSPSQVQDSLA